MQFTGRTAGHMIKQKRSSKRANVMLDLIFGMCINTIASASVTVNINTSNLCLEGTMDGHYWFDIECWISMHLLLIIREEGVPSFYPVRS
jgi:hypothetical protein